MMRRRLLRSCLALSLALCTLWSYLSVVWLDSQGNVAAKEGVPLSDFVGDNMGNFTKKVMSYPSIQSKTLPSAGFIHLGKTAGSNLARLLKNGCHSFRQPCQKTIANETMISKVVKAYYHLPLDTERLPNSTHSIYFLTSREPYQRFVSAFVYLHPRNKGVFQRPQSKGDMFQKAKAYSCFKTLQSFADYVGDDPFQYKYQPAPYVNSRNCTILARAMIAGQVQPIEHMYNNYQHMLQWIPNNKPLYMIRQEHLWEDWTDINQRYLHQVEPVILPDERSRRNVTTDVSPPVKKIVNALGRDRLCQALKPEYAAYLQLLQKAVNIPPAGVEEAVAMGEVECPHLNLKELLQHD